MQTQLQEKKPNFYSNIDENGYSPEFVQLIVNIVKLKPIEPPSQDIDDIMKWLDE